MSRLRTRWLTGLGLGLALLALGCATTPSADPAPTRQPADFYPLAVGNSWTYEVETIGASVVTDTVRIEREEDGYFVDSHGGRIQARSTGLFDGDRFLLEGPLEVGHEWLAVPGPSTVEKYRIAAVDERVVVPAGDFRDCVRVVAQTEGHDGEGNRARLTVEWSYAPQVGLVRLRQSVATEGGAPQRNLELRLVDYALADPTGAAASAP